MGLWGASQAYAAGIAALISTSLVDTFSSFINQPAMSYGMVFSIQGMLFLYYLLFLGFTLLTRVKQQTQH